MTWCCIEPERIEKTTWLMEAIAKGFGGKTCIGPPPDDEEPCVVWGQKWTAAWVIPRSLRSGRPFLQVDNGYVQPGRGERTGYYRLCFNGLSARMIEDAPASRIAVQMRPWRQHGVHLVFAEPGAGFGRAIGLDMPEWIAMASAKLRRSTRLPIMTRPKTLGLPLARHLDGSWALVTHSSNIAVDAVLYGIPVFVEPTSPAAPVGNLTWDELNGNPRMPDRAAWFNSLMAQQFTVGELENGFARDCVKLVAKDF